MRRQALQASLFREVINGFALVLQQGRADRTGQWRSQWPQVPPVEVAARDILRGDPEPAFDVASQTALNYRLDLMNQRARVVDAWRQLAVTANALLGVFNVEYHLSAFSPRGQAQPLVFDGSRVQNQLVLNAQLPLVRLAERNAYRTALINYQKERRDLLTSIGAALLSEYLMRELVSLDRSRTRRCSDGVKELIA